MFPNACRRLNKARAVRTVQPRKKISIARDNSLTTSIRCGVVWMNGPTGKIATANSNKAISRANNKGNNQVSSKVNKGKRAKKDNRDNKVRKDSRDHKADNRAVNNQAASNPAARRMVVVSPRQTGSAWDRIRARSWVAAMVGVTRDSFHLKYASGCVKLRTCDVSGARPATARGSSMK